MKKYLMFGAMILTSTAVMLILMYFNTYQWGHIFFSETRLYMAFLMGGAMAVVMMAFMYKKYPKKFANISIIIAGLIIIVSSTFLVRSQATVDDVSYMRAMIPHHSIAILTSKRANIKDPRVRDLADRIIDAQLKEIDEMKVYIEDLKNK